MIDPDLHAKLTEEGYSLLRVTPSGEITGLKAFLFTTAIVVGLDEGGYHHRYCYDNLLEAVGAYSDWDGTGDPEGFIKRKPEV